MKAANALVLPLIAAAGLCVVAADVQAQRHGGSSGYRGGGHASVPGGRWSGGRHTGSTPRYGYGHGNRHYHGGRANWAWWGAVVAAPFLWGGLYYDWPYYGTHWGPRYYRYYSPEASYPDDFAEYGYSRPDNEVPVPSTEVTGSNAGAPTERPLYLNYCEESKAYYPKVTSCASGWQMRRPTFN